MPKRPKRSGFTVIELIIVIAFIALIAIVLGTIVFFAMRHLTAAVPPASFIAALLG